jgi:hypothetical protein
MPFPPTSPRAGHPLLGMMPSQEPGAQDRLQPVSSVVSAYCGRVGRPSYRLVAANHHAFVIKSPVMDSPA